MAAGALSASIKTARCLWVVLRLFVAMVIREAVLGIIDATAADCSA